MISSKEGPAGLAGEYTEVSPNARCVAANGTLFGR